MSNSAYDVSSSDYVIERQAQAARSTRINNYIKTNPLANTRGILATNAGIANDAYFNNFSSRVAFGGQGLTDLLQTKNFKNEAPVPYNAESLWTNSRSSKGMFVQSDYLSSTGAENGYTGKTAGQQLDSLQKYAFSFHYNPTTINMSYQGLADIDYTMFTSGREAFNLLGTQATQSTISFNIVLNRLLDRRYFDSNTELLRPDVNAADWAGRFPSDAAEQREIYRKGTMYDIEFFLRTVMQIPISVYLKQRNSLFLAGSGKGTTADVGFLTGVPVEVHLGKSLRYLVRVDTFNLNHIIFSEDMVPLFTEMSLTLSRIPDYSADVVDAGDRNRNPEASSSTNEFEQARFISVYEPTDSLLGLTPQEQAIVDNARR